MQHTRTLGAIETEEKLYDINNGKRYSFLRHVVMMQALKKQIESFEI